MPWTDAQLAKLVAEAWSTSNASSEWAACVAKGHNMGRVAPTPWGRTEGDPMTTDNDGTPSESGDA